MGGALVRMGVLAVLSALIPLVLVGLAAWQNPHTIDGPAQAAIFSLVLVACTYVGWAARDGYHRWYGSKGPVVWAAISVVASFGVFLLWFVSLSGTNDPESAGMFALMAGTLAILSVVSWLIGRAMPEGSFDVQDEPVD